MVDCLAPDVRFHSPVAFRPFDGRDAVAALFAQLMATFSAFEYTDELSNDQHTTVLVFRARVGDKAVEGIDLLRCGADGLITEFTVMLRPLSAIMALGEAMAPVAATLPKAGSAAGHAPTGN